MSSSDHPEIDGSYVDRVFREQMVGMQGIFDAVLFAPDDGYDKGPRYIHPVLLPKESSQSIPLGHIAFQGDFDTPPINKLD